MSKLRTAVLGASGLVGQRFCEMLSGHPFFDIPDLYATERSEGRTVADVLQITEHRIERELLESRIMAFDVRDICKERYDAIFCALPGIAAAKFETELSASGNRLFTNASPNRMRPDVPLVVPEVNHEHLSLVAGKKGFIVANGNCSAIGLALGLKPLEKYGIDNVEVTTLQALSGAGYPGIPSLDSTANVIPYIESEEEKLSQEIPKMFGSISNGAVISSDIEVNATCTRVPVREGHVESVTVMLGQSVSLEDVVGSFTSFRSLPQELSLPSAPVVPIVVRSEANRPQPLFDVNAGEPESARGMAASVGRVRVIGNTVRFVILTHNTIRGAAGGSVLNAEIMHARGDM
ncbi:MAG: aspartate-semialdehyde dehydrogenase [Candidatus Thermoplasmatota archaeon]|nr:aspartate-semialdehyde dehydrogenase [Candidatus Thermoplasmatota archaeon]